MVRRLASGAAGSGGFGECGLVLACLRLFLRPLLFQALGRGLLDLALAHLTNPPVRCAAISAAATAVEILVDEIPRLSGWVARGVRGAAVRRGEALGLGGW